MPSALSSKPETSVGDALPRPGFPESPHFARVIRLFRSPGILHLRQIFHILSRALRLLDVRFVPFPPCPVPRIAMQALLVAGFILCFGGGVSFGVTSASGDSLFGESTSRPASTRLILRLKDTAVAQPSDARGASAAREALAGKVARVLTSIQVDSGTVRALPILGLSILDGMGTDSAAMDRLAAHPDVDWVEYSLPRPLHDATTEPLFRYQWALENTADPEVKAELEARGFLPITMVPGADIGAREAWQAGEGSPRVVAAILDSGLDTTHIDLARNLWVNEGEIPGNGVDDDNNGYVDDVHGWNAFAGNGDPTDILGHGTHVAGIVAAAANGRGVAGVAPRVKIMAVNVLNPATLWEDDAAVITGVEYILNQAWRGVNVRVVNVSLGGPGKSRSLEYAFSSLAREGILAVLSAGNESVSNDLFISDYPRNCPLPNIIAVGASDPADAPVAFSNFGVYSTDIFAPGTSIVSSIPKVDADTTSWTNGKYSWGVKSGTSMSAPMVTGAVAFACGLHPGADWRQIKDLVLSSARRIDAFEGFARRRGRLDLAALAERSPLPRFPAVYRLGELLPLPGETTTIFGHNLGSEAGGVTLGGSPLEILSWTPSEVTVRLPKASADRGPWRAMTVGTATGASASMPILLADVGPSGEISIGNGGGYSAITPYENKMAVMGGFVYGVIRCGPASGAGFETEAGQLAWGRLNLRTQRLDYLGELPAAVSNWYWAAVAGLGDHVYCLGGVAGGRMWRYHVPSGTWDDSTPQPIVEMLALPTLTADGEHLYMAGGSIQDNSSAIRLNTTVYRFDPDSASWTAIGEWPETRIYATALVSGTRLLLAGGILPIPIPQYPSNRCDVLDLTTGQWITTPMPVGVVSGQMARIGNTLTFFAPRERTGATTPFVFSTPWPPKKARPWRIHPVRFDFLDLDRTSSWAFRYQGDIHMAGGDVTGCPAFPCRARLRTFSLGLDQ